MNAYQDLNDSLWKDRYNQVIAPIEKGKILVIAGTEGMDTYNPMLCEYNGNKILAFRYETRLSEIDDTANYHPSILFAKSYEHGWKLVENIAPFDMLEDPLFMEAKLNGQECVVFGGVRATLVSEGHFVANTEFYKGDSLESLDRNPFAIIKGMKDERLCQLPDGRFLLCRRPVDEFGIGRAILHVINDLEDLQTINDSIPKAAVKIEGPLPGDWVGINNIYILKDTDNIDWVCLLGHIGNVDEKGRKHYAATTYRLKLDDVLDQQAHDILPTIIATRSCFEDGPQKDEFLSDVVFPGSLERLDGNRYRLWAGLSDARIGVIEITDPFGFEK